MEVKVFTIGLYFALFQLVYGLHIPLSEQFHIEETKVEFLSSASPDRSRRDTRSLPENSVLQLSVTGTQQHINVERNYNIDVTQIPIFIRKDDTVEQTYISLQKEHVLYQAPEVGGSFLVTHHKNNSSVNREIFGTFHHNSSLYIIQPNINLQKQYGGHVVSRVPDQRLVFESLAPNGVPSPTFRQKKDSGNHDNKRNRRQIEKYSIELMSVIDYQSYKFWYDKTSGTNRRSDAVQDVMQYIAYIINSVDMRYKTFSGENIVFDILSAGVFIADTPESSPWSEDIKIDGKVNSGTVLDTFTAWVNKQTSLPQYDHAMGFTGYNVVSEGSGDSAGIAFTEVLCTSSSTSIVEDRFNFITMATAAHELGHSLGARHDGSDGNTCNGDDNYIMSSVNRVVGDPVIGQHLWQFSTCSVQEFKAYIDKLDRLNSNCMLETSNTAKIPTTLRPMAEAYPADDTCVYRFGEGSYVCRSIQNYETICTSMFCNEPGTQQCYSTIPAEGTPCGKGKWCEQGKCVASALAPTDNADNCALGDRPGVFDDTSKTCAQLVNDEPSKCYGDYTGANCCDSCNSKKTGDASCEYGDHEASFCSTMARFGCYNNEQFCCSTCKTLKNNALPGCEFGDKFTGCNKNDCWRYNADNLAGCCETCFDPTKTVKTTTSTTTPKSTPTTKTTTTSTTTSTTTTKRTTTKSTTKPTTPTIKPTTPTTKSATPSPTTTLTTTAKPESTKGTHQTEITPTEIPADSKGSDWLYIVAGSCVGVVVVIVLVIVLCIYLRKRKAARAASNGRKPSKDNAYDNIGFVAAMTEKPNHPPPRRGSNHSAQHNTSNGSRNIPISFIGNGSSVHVDGYMMPASVQPTTPEPVHYTAPNKPKVKPLVPPNKPNKKAFTAPKPSPDLSKRSSKPVHYKRTSGMSNSSTETIDRNVSSNTFGNSSVNSLILPDAYDSIGEIQKLPQSRRPTLPENHPRRFHQTDRVKNNPENKTDSKKNGKHIPKNISDDEKRKVLPSISPRPIPRIKSRDKGQTTDLNLSIPPDNNNQTKTSEQDNTNNGYEEMDNVKFLGDVIKSLKPPSKPVPRRQISSVSSDNEIPEVPLKQALRPPMKPVPRRRTTSGNQVHFNHAFDNEQLEIEI